MVTGGEGDALIFWKKRTEKKMQGMGLFLEKDKTMGMGKVRGLWRKEDERWGKEKRGGALVFLKKLSF